MILKQNLLFITVVSLSIALTFGCKNMKDDQVQDSEPVARVGSDYLQYSDIAKLVSPTMTSEDSAQLVSNYVDNWVTQKLILKKAESSLSESQKNVTKELSEYRNSLIRYKYEQKIIRNFLDTNVSDEAIEKYYSSNQRNFLLKENIVKAVFIKVGQDAPKLKDLNKWYRSGKDEDRVALAEYCHQYAKDFYLDDVSWISFEELIRKVPIRTFNYEEFLRQNRFVELKDSLDLYFVNINSFKIKESVSPLEFERENIRNLIINKRKRELITKMESDIYQKAIKSRDFEIYTKE